MALSVGDRLGPYEILALIGVGGMGEVYKARDKILEPNALQWNLDLAPDGKRFVVAPRPDATGGQKGSVHVTVLLNFFDELRRKMPAESK